MTKQDGQRDGKGTVRKDATTSKEDNAMSTETNLTKLDAKSIDKLTASQCKEVLTANKVDFKKKSKVGDMQGLITVLVKDAQSKLVPADTNAEASASPVYTEAQISNFQTQCPTFKDCDITSDDCKACQKDASVLFDACLTFKASQKKTTKRESSKPKDPVTGFIIDSKLDLFTAMLRKATDSGAGLLMSQVKVADWNDRKATFYDCFNSLRKRDLAHKDGKNLFYGPAAEVNETDAAETT